MKIKLWPLINVLGLKPHFDSQKLPIQVVFNLSKIFEAASKEYVFYKEKFQELSEKYCERDGEGRPVYLEDGSGISIRDGDSNECMKELEALQNIEVEVPDYKIPYEVLEGSVLTLSEFELLKPFIQFA